MMVKSMSLETDSPRLKSRLRHTHYVSLDSLHHLSESWFPQSVAWVYSHEDEIG